MNLYSLSFAIVLSSVPLLSCAQTPSPRYEILNPQNDDIIVEKSIHELEHSDPVRDFKLAIKRNDLRFVGLYGYVPFAPGIEDELFACRHGLRMIEGTSHNARSPGIIRLNRLASDYAKRYNALLLRYFEERRSETKGAPIK